MNKTNDSSGSERSGDGGAGFEIRAITSDASSSSRTSLRDQTPWQRAHHLLNSSVTDIIDSIQFRRGYKAYWACDFKPAMRILAPLAHRNDCAAQYYLGRMFARGEGVTTNTTEAIRWWNASAGRGERWAQVEIGNLYETGNGLPQEYAKAMKWYRRAADAGLAEAQVRVGYFLDNGLGTPKSHASARQWYIRAAVQGERNAYHNLAIHYARGLGVPADRQKALAWLRKAMPHQADEARLSDDVVSG